MKHRPALRRRLAKFLALPSAQEDTAGEFPKDKEDDPSTPYLRSQRREASGPDAPSRSCGVRWQSGRRGTAARACAHDRVSPARRCETDVVLQRADLVLPAPRLSGGREIRFAHGRANSRRDRRAKCGDGAGLQRGYFKKEFADIALGLGQCEASAPILFPEGASSSLSRSGNSRQGRSPVYS